MRRAQQQPAGCRRMHTYERHRVSSVSVSGVQNRSPHQKRRRPALLYVGTLYAAVLSGGERSVGSLGRNIMALATDMRRAV